MNTQQENTLNTRRKRSTAGRVRKRRQSRVIILLALPLMALCIMGVYMLTRTGNESSVDDSVGNLYRPSSSRTSDDTYAPVGNVELTLRERYSKIVWLDAGHGGNDGGTDAIHNGTKHFEKDIVLNIVLMVYEMFNQSDSGIKALLTRSDDTGIPFSERPELWNDVADLVVSVHADYYEGPTAHQVCGIQVNYYGNNSVNTGRVNLTNSQFAQIMQNHLVAETGARDRRIRGDRAFTVCARSTMPALLIETGFMSNPNELALLVTEEYQLQLATAIYNAIVEAFGFIRR